MIINTKIKPDITALPSVYPLAKHMKRMVVSYYTGICVMCESNQRRGVM